MRSRVSDELLLQTLLENPGASDEEIGRKLNLSRVQVSRRKNRPEFKAIWSSEFKLNIDLLKKYKGKAVRRICALIDSKDERIALKACELVLAKAPTETPESGGSDQVIQRLIAIAKGAGTTKD